MADLPQPKEVNNEIIYLTEIKNNTDDNTNTNNNINSTTTQPNHLNTPNNELANILENVPLDSNVADDVVVDVAPPPTLVTVTRSINLPVETDPSIQITVPNPNEAVVMKAYDTLSTMIKNKKITQNNVLELVGMAIKVVQTLKRGKETLTNEEKKSIVITLVIKIVNDISFGNEGVKSYLVDVFIPLLLPGAIDSLCELDVNVVKSGKFCCFT